MVTITSPTQNEGSIVTMKMLKSLKTSRRTYEDIIAFDSLQEAVDAGFHILYHDEVSGDTVYGKPLDPAFPKVCRVAVVLNAERYQNF